MLNTMMQVQDGTLNEGKTNEESAKWAWSEAEIVSNAFVFFVAG